MVMATSRVAPATLAEKYINQRWRRFTRVHQASMAEYLAAGRGDEQAYWTWFRGEIERSAAEVERQTAQVQNDPLMNVREKQAAITEIEGRRRQPAWGQKDEETFISVYGDPMALARNQVMSLLAQHEDREWTSAIREGQPKVVAKTPWELKVYSWLTAPRDGSVPVVTDDRLFAALSAQTEREPGFEVRETEEHVIELVADDPRYARAMQEAAEKVCPKCFRSFERKVSNTHIDSEPCLALQAENEKATT